MLIKRLADLLTNSHQQKLYTINIIITIIIVSQWHKPMRIPNSILVAESDPAKWMSFLDMEKCKGCLRWWAHLGFPRATITHTERRHLLGRTLGGRRAMIRALNSWTHCCCYFSGALVSAIHRTTQMKFCSSKKPHLDIICELNQRSNHMVSFSNGQRTSTAKIKWIYKYNLSHQLVTVSRLIFSYRNLWTMIIISWRQEGGKKTEKISRKLYKLKKKKNLKKWDCSEIALLNVFMQTALINLIQTWIFL